MRFGVSLLLFSLGLHCYGQSPEPLAPIDVSGKRTDHLEQASPQQIKLRKAESQDVTDVLKKSSGVYSRGEDSHGLRPNIGLRGTHPDRSKKIGFLEDNVLIGPAPYTSPAAYFHPSVAQMENLDVLKGFEAFGLSPNSVGGALNFKAAARPLENSQEILLGGGSYGTETFGLRLKGINSSFGGAYALNASQLQSDGFKRNRFDESYGFYRRDFLLQQWLSLGTSQDDDLELRFGLSEEVSAETYLGLTDSDFAVNPNLRYMASDRDEMRWEHQRLQIRHRKSFVNDIQLRQTLYSHHLHRRWYRLDRLRGPHGLRKILENPQQYSDLLGVLRGDSNSVDFGPDAELIVADNDRFLLSRGYQLEFSRPHADGGNWGWFYQARLHEDQIRREHNSDRYQMENSRMVRTTDPRQIETRETDRAQNLSQFLRLDIRGASPQVILSPMFNWEQTRLRNLNDQSQASSESTHHTFLRAYSLLLVHPSETLSFRFSQNQASTLTGIKAGSTGIREEALNSEMELRWDAPSGQQALEMTLFHLDYAKVAGTCSASAGCGSAQLDAAFQGGSALVQGVEFSWAQNWPVLWFDSFQTTTSASLIDAKFTSDFSSQSPEWGSDVRSGDPLPYVPKAQYQLALQQKKGRLASELILSYSSQMYDQAASFDQVSEAPRRIIEAAGVVDAKLTYDWSDQLQGWIRGDNLLGRENIVSRRPFGLRPGKPLSIQLGLKYAF